MAKIVSTMDIGSPMNRSRSAVMAGLVLFAVLFGGFGTWAAVMPLASSVLGNGRIVVSSSRQTVQHLEGGIIKTIHVKDGDAVVAGQPLIELDPTQAMANHILLSRQYLAASAQKARLMAEMTGAPEIEFPDELVEDMSIPQAAEFVLSQKQTFESRRAFIATQKEIFANQIEQLDLEIVALRAQAQATMEQHDLLQEEAEVVRRLVESGNQTRVRYNTLLRSVAEAKGNYDEITARIAQSEQRKNEVRGQSADLDNRMRTEVANGLSQVEVSLSDLTQRRAAAQDVLERTFIRAPRDGVILNLRFRSPRGVIGAGQPILDIMPTDEPLLIEAQFNPKDIEVLRVGAPASVMLSAYSQRRMPRIEGVLTWVSADSITTDATPQGYFLGHVEVDRDKLAELDAGIQMLPGMPADVMVLDQERTMLQYLINPIFSFAERAGRES